MKYENTNWYKNAKIAETIQQEAALKDLVPLIPIGLASALVAVFLGSGIQNAAKRYQVSQEEIQHASQEEIQHALSNPEIVEQVKGEMQVRQPSKPQETQKTQKTQEIPSGDFNTNVKENVIARTIYAEGRNEPTEGLMAIATVIYNRGNGNVDNMIQAIKNPKQFSCWNKATSSDWTNMKQGKGTNWGTASNIANSIINGTFQPIGSWNHYYNPKLANPYWGYVDKQKTKLRPHNAIGNHIFMTM